MAISFSNNLQKCTHYFVDVDVYKPQKLRKNWFIYLTNSTKQWRSTQHKSLTNIIKALYIRSSKTPNSYFRALKGNFEIVIFEKKDNMLLSFVL